MKHKNANIEYDVPDCIGDSSSGSKGSFSTVLLILIL